MDLLFSNDLRNRPYVTNRKTAYTQLPVFSLYDYGGDRNSSYLHTRHIRAGD